MDKQHYRKTKKATEEVIKGVVSGVFWGVTKSAIKIGLTVGILAGGIYFASPYIKQGYQSAKKSLSESSNLGDLWNSVKTEVTTFVENQEKAQEAYVQSRPVLEGLITKEGTIPSSLSERAQQEHPYFVDIEDFSGTIYRVRFDTDDPFYDSEKDKKRGGMSVSFGKSTDFRNKALDLESRFEMGDYVKIRVKEDQLSLDGNALEILEHKRKYLPAENPLGQ